MKNLFSFFEKRRKKKLGLESLTSDESCGTTISPRNYANYTRDTDLYTFDHTDACYDMIEIINSLKKPIHHGAITFDCNYMHLPIDVVGELLKACTSPALPPNISICLNGCLLSEAEASGLLDILSSGIFIHMPEMCFILEPYLTVFQEYRDCFNKLPLYTRSLTQETKMFMIETHKSPRVDSQKMYRMWEGRSNLLKPKFMLSERSEYSPLYTILASNFTQMPAALLNIISSYLAFYYTFDDFASEQIEPQNTLQHTSLAQNGMFSSAYQGILGFRKNQKTQSDNKFGIVGIDKQDDCWTILFEDRYKTYKFASAYGFELGAYQAIEITGRESIERFISYCDDEPLLYSDKPVFK